MIEIYTWPTPNGHKVHIMLEETGLEYRVIPVDINEGEQFAPEFLKIAPNNRIPAMVDPDGPGGEPISLFESGAILIYLAEKTGRFLPADPHGRYTTLQWLMFQMGNIGPMLGQAHHFRIYAREKIPYAIQRYTNEATRLYRVVDHRLGESEWIAGEEYTIADMAIWPWLRRYERQGQNLDDYPNLARWYHEMVERPAVQRALKVLADRQTGANRSDKAWDTLFGTGQLKHG